MILPLRLSAEAWLSSNADAGAIWNGDELVVEMRYFPNRAEAIIAAGFLFERNSFPN